MLRTVRWNCLCAATCHAFSVLPWRSTAIGYARANEKHQKIVECLFKMI